MTVEDLRIYLESYPDDAQVYAYCDDGSLHTVADADPVCIRLKSFGIILNLGNEIS